jgi:general secretion pathway protein I
MKRRGFTLLEVMVATAIMGIAVVGLLSGISQSLRNADRVTDYDRAALLARSKMDDLLLNYQLPKGTVIADEFPRAVLGGKEGGWRARITPFDFPPKPAPGTEIVERISMEIWWKTAPGERKFNLEGFRTDFLRPEDIAAMQAGEP